MERLFTSQTPDQADKIFYRCVEDCFEPIMLTDRRGVLQYVNPAWTLTYGYSREEAIGQTPRLLRSELQDDSFYQDMWKTILDPKMGFWRGEVINQAKDGHLVPVLLTITPYRDSTGEIVGYMGIAVDLSDQKRMEQQILHQDRLASIGMLSGGLAHEIGNPLGVIRGRAEMLMMQIQNLPAAAKNLDVILSQIDRISGLIRSLLRVSRVPDKMLLRETRLDAVLEEVGVLMEETCRRAGIELRFKDLDHVIMAEPSHLHQLFLNLILNATHAIEEQKSKGLSPLPGVGKQSHFIEISAVRERESKGHGEMCCIRVRDSGSGIAPQNMKKLFQPFFTTKAAGVGTGMGLAVVSKLVEEMQGRVSAESQGPGFGATFIIRLQIHTDSEPSE